MKVMLSASKYIGGHSDMTGGALVTKDPGLAQRRWEMMSSWGFIDYEGFRLKASGFPFWVRCGHGSSRRAMRARDRSLGHTPKAVFGTETRAPWSSPGKARFFGQSCRRHSQPLRG